MTTDSRAWQTFGTRTIYDNRWVRLDLVDVQAPNGDRFEHHVVHLDTVALALLVNDRDEVLMLHRHRFAIDAWGYELLGGMVEHGETPATAAEREAIEESGWRPLGAPTHLARFEPIPGMVTARTDVFLWHGADHIGEPTDTEEAGTLHWVPANRARQLLARNELLGAGTIIGIQAWLLGADTVHADTTNRDF